MLIQTLPIPIPLTIPAEPLTPTAFSPFGSVLANPAPERQPHNTPASALPSGYGAVSTNQGTAIQYRALAPPLRNLYDQAPSRKPATPRTTMFVCGARQLVPDLEPDTRDKRKQKQRHKHKHRSDSSSGNTSSSSEGGLFQVQILERHPYTTQTFIPLGASSTTRYLVIVAPTLPPSPSPSPSSFPSAPQNNNTPKNQSPPVPTGTDLPGSGLPDLKGLRAFVATGAQAVTYGAGTWHAPMAALGAAGSAVDFVVVQFANDEPVEDCQEVALEGRGGTGEGEREDKEKGEVEKEGADEARIMVRVPVAHRVRLSKL
ncbi:hypothetical protein F4776DRAFT_461445 [Hypoxylon sp. NC0597]|nr:hypothetical protein F4776DRAFT_461445 [Hypoxylon sp. NC0597]